MSIDLTASQKITLNYYGFGFQIESMPEYDTLFIQEISNKWAKFWLKEIGKRPPALFVFPKGSTKTGVAFDDFTNKGWEDLQKHKEISED